MAWNQPGGQNQNPWGKRPNQGGGDFDQTFKDWQKRFEGMFGGGKGGAPGATGGGGIPLPVIIIVAVAIWLLSGFYQVNAPERGVVQRFGKYVETRPPGIAWHLPWPIETVKKVNVSNVNSVQSKSRVLTADVNLVELEISVQYRLANPEKYLFGVRDPEETLREVSESAIREVVGRSELQRILSGGRQQVTELTRDLIQKTMEQYGTGIEVRTVNMEDVQVPEAVVPSQREANKAIADKERFIKEAEAYASGILPVAEGAALRQAQDAEAYKAQVIAIAEGEAGRFSQLAKQYAAAPGVTRDRLYIETVENVMSRSRKVIVDSKGSGGTNNVMVLPLERLMERRADGADAATVTVTPQAVEAVPAQSDARQRGER
jgi:membrane protease subunit HflK